MVYYYYKLFVKERAGLTEDSDAESAIRAVFEVLGQRLSLEQAEELAGTLPLEIRGHLMQNPFPRPFGAEEFLAGVGKKEGVDRATAEIHTRSVLSVLADYLPSVELLKTLDQIPKEIRHLFLWKKEAA
jgi:uncharacterized protein (DUF2267 family)